MSPEQRKEAAELTHFFFYEEKKYTQLQREVSHHQITQDLREGGHSTT